MPTTSSLSSPITGKREWFDVGDDLQHFLGRLILRDDDHVAARHHDVADLRVGDLEHALQHRELVGADDAALEEACEELGYVVAGLGVTARP